MSHTYKDEKLNNYAIKAIRLMNKGLEPYEVCGVLGIKFNTLVLAMKRFGDEEVNIHLQHIINKNKKQKPELKPDLRMSSIKAPPSSPIEEPEPLPEPEPEVVVPEVVVPEVVEPEVVESEFVEVSDTTYLERDIQFRYKIVQYKLSGISNSDIAKITNIVEDEVSHILAQFNII